MGEVAYVSSIHQHKVRKWLCISEKTSTNRLITIVPALKVRNTCRRSLNNVWLVDVAQ